MLNMIYYLYLCQFLKVNKSYKSLKIEDLTQVVISYEIYERSLQRVSQISISYEMTLSIRLFLSYDNLKGILSCSK